jgi:acetolactate synthase-1/2/3 large subunit
MADERSTAEVITDALLAADVPTIYAYPGDPNIEIMERARAKGINVVLARREGTAAFMAEAHALTTGGHGVCVSTLGPGSTALLNGVAAANLDRVPMVAISGQIESSREQFFTHQVVDHKLLYSPVTKWAARVEPGAAATTMRRALSLSMAERPGAVHLTVAADATRAVARDADFTLPPLASSVAATRVHRAADGRDPLALLSGARRPVVLAGIAAMRGNATGSLVAFAEATSIPVVVGPMAKGVFPEDHPLFAGVFEMACNQVLWEYLGASDLIITVGFDAVELIKPWSLRVPVLHIDSTPNTDQIYASECECVGDIAATLDWLRSEFHGEPRWAAADVEAHRQTLRDAYYAGRVEGHLNPTDVVDTVRAAMPRDTIATTDVGSHKMLIGQGWQTFHPRSTFMTNGLSAMGFGLPAAIAAKLARPTRPVAALIGDGGFAMTATELRLASELKLGIVFVVFVDGSLNRIELKQMALGYPSTATRIEDIDLVGMAESMKCDGVRVETQIELEKALTDVGSLTRPLVVEARIDPSQYESQF